MYRSHNHQLHIAISGDLHSVNELFTENQNVIEGCHLVSVSFSETTRPVCLVEEDWKLLPHTLSFM